jgi:hypothetical protein
LASGDVTAQNNDNDLYTQFAEYLCKLSDGRIAVGLCIDASRSLHEGMTESACYDADNPTRTIHLDSFPMKVA